MSACRASPAFRTRMAQCAALIAPYGPTLALWRLAIDAGADRRRYRLGLAAHPRRNDRAEAAGRAPCGHDQEMLRRFERGMDALAAVAHDRALPYVRPFGAAHTSAFVQEVGDVTLGPARPLD